MLSRIMGRHPSQRTRVGVVMALIFVGLMVGTLLIVSDEQAPEIERVLEEHGVSHTAASPSENGKREQYSDEGLLLQVLTAAQQERLSVKRYQSLAQPSTITTTPLEHSVPAVVSDTIVAEQDAKEVHEATQAAGKWLMMMQLDGHRLKAAEAEQAVAEARQHIQRLHSIGGHEDTIRDVERTALALVELQHSQQDQGQEQAAPPTTMLEESTATQEDDTVMLAAQASKHWMGLIQRGHISEEELAVAIAQAHQHIAHLRSFRGHDGEIKELRSVILGVIRAAEVRPEEDRQPAQAVPMQGQPTALTATTLDTETVARSSVEAPRAVRHDVDDGSLEDEQQSLQRAIDSLAAQNAAPMSMSSNPSAATTLLGTTLQYDAHSQEQKAVTKAVAEAKSSIKDPTRFQVSTSVDKVADGMAERVASRLSKKVRTKETEQLKAKLVLEQGKLTELRVRENEAKHNEVKTQRHAAQVARQAEAYRLQAEAATSVSHTKEAELTKRAKQLLEPLHDMGQPFEPAADDDGIFGVTSPAAPSKEEKPGAKPTSPSPQHSSAELLSVDAVPESSFEYAVELLRDAPPEMSRKDLALGLAQQIKQGLPLGPRPPTLLTEAPAPEGEMVMVRKVSTKAAQQAKHQKEVVKVVKKVDAVMGAKMKQEKDKLAHAKAMEEKIDAAVKKSDEAGVKFQAKGQGSGLGKKIRTVATPAVKPMPKPAPEAKPKPAPEVKPKPAPEGKPKAMPKAMPKVKPEAKPEAKAKPVPKVAPALAKATSRLKAVSKQMQAAAHQASQNAAPSPALSHTTQAATKQMKKVEASQKTAAAALKVDYAAKLRSKLAGERQGEISNTMGRLTAAKKALQQKENKLESASEKLQALSKLQMAAAAALGTPADPTMPTPAQVRAAAANEAAQKAQTSKAAAQRQKKVSQEAAKWAAKMSADALKAAEAKRQEAQRLKTHQEAFQLMKDSSQIYSQSGGAVSSATSRLSNMANAMYDDVQRQKNIAQVSERRSKANHVTPPQPAKPTPKALSLEAQDQVAELVNATTKMVDLIKDPDRGYTGSIGVDAVRVASRVRRLSKLLDLGRKTMKNGVQADKFEEADEVLKIVGADVDTVGHVPIPGQSRKTPAVAAADTNTARTLGAWGVSQPQRGNGVTQVAPPPEAPPRYTGAMVSTDEPVVTQRARGSFLEEDGGLFAPPAIHSSHHDFNEPPPAWVEQGKEAPAGTKDMGGWLMRVYTPEQQQRLGVNALGDSSGPSPPPSASTTSTASTAMDSSPVVQQEGGKLAAPVTPTPPQEGPSHWGGDGPAMGEMEATPTLSTNPKTMDASTQKALELVRLIPEDSSSIWHVHRFPSRLTCFEQSSFHQLEVGDAATEAARRFESMAQQLSASGYHLSNLKVGKDTRFKLSLGTSLATLPVEAVQKELAQLGASGLMDAGQGQNLLTLLHAAARSDTSAYKALQQASRLLQQVSWSLAEVTAGIKQLRTAGDGSPRPLHLAEAFSHGTPVVLEVFGSFNSRLQALEVAYDLGYGLPRGQLTAGAARYKQVLLEEALLDMAEQRPMQAAQQLWSVSVVTNDHALRRRLSPLLADKVSSLPEVQTAAATADKALAMMTSPPFEALARASAWMQRALRRQGSAKPSANPGIFNDMIEATIQHLKEVQSAVVHRRSSAVFDTQAVRRHLQEVGSALQPEVARQAKLLTTALAHTRALSEAETAIVPAPLAAVEANAAVESQMVSTDTIDKTSEGAVGTFTPKIKLSEVPEAEWLDEPEFQQGV